MRSLNSRKDEFDAAAKLTAAPGVPTSRKFILSVSTFVLKRIRSFVPSVNLSASSVAATIWNTPAAPYATLSSVITVEPIVKSVVASMVVPLMVE